MQMSKLQVSMLIYLSDWFNRPYIGAIVPRLYTRAVYDHFYVSQCMMNQSVSEILREEVEKANVVIRRVDIS